jgi:hypothetical protein
MWHAHLAESISIETLAELAELSPFHFSRVFKQAMFSPWDINADKNMRYQQNLAGRRIALVGVIPESVLKRTGPQA